MRPGGNWGDHLIYAGAEQLASRMGLVWTNCDASNFTSAPATADQCIYLHGGGGYNSWGSGRPFQNLASAVARNVHLVVQGPQTIESGSVELQRRLAGSLKDRRCERLVFFAREKLSFAALRSFDLPGVELAIDHDTAFHLACDDLLRLAHVHDLPAGRYALTAYREDDEQPAGAEGTPVQGVVMDPAFAATSFEHWLRIHLFASSLLTNRLHSGIVCVLARKPVTLAFGSYHKNRSIWEYSLARLGVNWTSGIAPPRKGIFDHLPRRLRESYKLRKLKLALHRVPLR